MSIARISSTPGALTGASETALSSETSIHEGESLLDIIRRSSSIDFPAPCGGEGTCGKCRIKLLSGECSPASEEEKKILSDEERSAGIRLACKTYPMTESDIHLLIPKNGGSQVRTSAAVETFTGPARFSRLPFRLPETSLSDQRSLTDRLETEEGERIDIPGRLGSEFLQRVAPLTASENIVPALLLDEDKPIDILLPEDRPVGFSVDIGTTTIVVRMADLLTGEPLGLRSGLNAQRSCGADVISRIKYATEASENLEKIRTLIVNQLNGAVSELLTETGTESRMVKRITVAGNTTMLHLLLGVDPAGIAAAPFIPVFTAAQIMPAGPAGFSAAPEALLELLPSVSAYVGADITAGMGVSDLLSFEHPVLFIDIGTNGEMALARNGEVLCCSTAAGPAFEGANISEGTGGIPGAIDKVYSEDGSLKWTTIQGKTALGICGSGIIDAAALLVDTGAAEFTGRILSAEESGFEWIIDTEEGPALRFASETGRSILFTQKDLREVQLAKAAVSAGILSLVHAAGLELADIGTVILAGGFGSYIDPERAGKIGLLPGGLSEITRAAGNTSGAGAMKMLLEKGAGEGFQQLAASCRYIELSSSPEFQNFYIEEMIFPEKETSR